MASFIYNSAIDDLANGNIDFGADTFIFLRWQQDRLPSHVKTRRGPGKLGA
jgi:hypothetical protein